MKPRNRAKIAATILAVAAAATNVHAAPDSVPIIVEAKPAACCTLPANTVVELQLTESVNSKHATRGTLVGFQLAAPIVVNGVTLVPAGAHGGGEVIDAKPGGMGGAPGRLSIAARFLSYNDQNIPLHALKLGGSGKSHAAASGAMSAAIGVLGLLVHGGEMEYPNGLLFQAKTGGDVVLPPLAAQAAVPATPAGSPPPPAPESTVQPTTPGVTH